MQKTSLLMLSLAILSMPLGQSHDDGVGAPKTYCEDYNQMDVHEYGPSVNSVVGGKIIHTSPPLFDGFQTEDSANLPPALVNALARGIMDGSTTTVANGSPGCIEGGWDHHFEYAVGGGWLFADAPVVDCWGGFADHTKFTDITVVDAVLTPLQFDVHFDVYADTLNNGPATTPNCGDFESDYGVNCINVCSPQFHPGLDGTYQVYVRGTSGHIYN